MGEKLNTCKKCGKQVPWQQTVEIYEEAGKFSLDKMVDLCFDCFEQLKVFVNYKSQ